MKKQNKDRSMSPKFALNKKLLKKFKISKITNYSHRSRNGLFEKVFKISVEKRKKKQKAALMVRSFKD